MAVHIMQLIFYSKEQLKYLVMEATASNLNIIIKTKHLWEGWNGETKIVD